MKIDEAIPVINKRIIEVIGHYVKLTTFDGTYHWGCCPRHKGRKQLLCISESKGIYKCFVCNEAGDAIQFIKQQEEVDFVTALSIASKILNIDVVLEENNHLITDEF